MGAPTYSKLAQDIIDFTHEFLRVPDGPNAGKKLVLRKWQQDIIGEIYAEPRLRRAIISFGRKNGKTALTATLILAHLIGPAATGNSQIYSAAQSRDQAALVFNFARQMVRMEPRLNALVRVVDSKKELHCGRTGVMYRALAADASTAYGLNPSLIIHDELGQVRGPTSEFYDALETATGAQRSPLSIIISTQAPTKDDLLSRLIDDAQSVDGGRTRVFLHECPIDHPEPFTRGAIELANPALGDFLEVKEVMDLAADAQRMMARESSFRNLILNQRVEARDPFVSRSVWETCGAPPQSIEGGVQVWGGLDLAAVHDLTALTLQGCIGGVWQVHPTFWLPESGIREKAKRDRVEWDVWAKQGHLNLTPGKSVDYDYIAYLLLDVFERHNIVKIAFDRAYFNHLRPALSRAGFHELVIEEKFMEFGQGWVSMSPALRRLECEILNQRIAHGNHPVLSMCAANAVVHMDPKGNRTLAKDKSSGRIDGLVALAMAMGAAPGEDPDLMNRTILERGGLP